MKRVENTGCDAVKVKGRRMERKAVEQGEQQQRQALDITSSCAAMTASGTHLHTWSPSQWPCPLCGFGHSQYPPARMGNKNKKEELTGTQHGTIIWGVMRLEQSSTRVS